MAIKFIEDYEVKAEGGATYAAGKIVKDLSPASEAHFVTRGAAEYVEPAKNEDNEKAKSNKK